MRIFRIIVLILLLLLVACSDIETLPATTTAESATPNGFAPSGQILVDTGFRPQINGLQFANPADRAGATITLTDLRQIFGDPAVCVTVLQANDCIPNPAAEQWLNASNGLLGNQLCEGMAVLSQLLYRGSIHATDLQPKAKAATDLRLDTVAVRAAIGRYAISQFFEPVAQAQHNIARQTPGQILDLLIAGLQPTADQPTLGIFQEGQGGHTLLPFAVEAKGDGLFWVWVYDPDAPLVARYLELNRATNTWRYTTIKQGSWSGNAQSFSLWLTPLSSRLAEAACPFCANNSTAMRQIIVSGGLRLLVLDDQGRRIGYSDQKFVNSIPGAFRVNAAGGTYGSQAEIFFLPANLKIYLQITGVAANEQRSASLVVVAPGSAVTFDQLQLHDRQVDLMSIDPNGALAYQAGANSQLRMTMAIRLGPQYYQFQLGQLRLAHAAELDLAVDPNKALLAIGGSDSVEYQLMLQRYDPGQIWQFQIPDVALASQSYQQINLTTWNRVANPSSTISLLNSAPNRLSDRMLQLTADQDDQNIEEIMLNVDDDSTDNATPTDELVTPVDGNSNNNNDQLTDPATDPANGN